MYAEWWDPNSAISRIERNWARPVAGNAPQHVVDENWLQSIAGVPQSSGARLLQVNMWQDPLRAYLPDACKSQQWH
jgi:elongation factor P--beta-lysine ligase